MLFSFTKSAHDTFVHTSSQAAMSAAFNNPERAVEYLFDPSSMPVAAAPAPAGVPPANPAAGLPANPAAGGIPANPAAGGDPAAALPPDLQAYIPCLYDGCMVRMQIEVTAKWVGA